MNEIHDTRIVSVKHYELAKDKEKLIKAIEAVLNDDRYSFVNIEIELKR